MKIRLIADKGKIYTNGVGIDGTDITLAEGLTAEGFYQIPIEEYEAILAEEHNEDVLPE